MKTAAQDLSEKNTKRAFSAQAAVFDNIYTTDHIIRYKRERVRAHLAQYLKPGATILELNAGTGEDALYFLQQGHRVHATDLSAKMLEQLAKKTAVFKQQNMISQQELSYHDLESLHNKGPYDCIFSNFAGLNCTGSLDQVLRQLPALLKTGGIVTLVILPGFCLWEFLLVFRGKIRTAFRRFFASKGRAAKIDDHHFRCWYYNPSYVMNCLEESCELLSVEGLCTIVPPSYLENFADKYPRLFHWLCKKEMTYKQAWPWKNMGDYYIISFRKK
jgi:ubiquinone/menaquinone biosynthesis C-methylase UbiE